MFVFSVYTTGQEVFHAAKVCVFHSTQSKKWTYLCHHSHRKPLLCKKFRKALRTMPVQCASGIIRHVRTRIKGKQTKKKALPEFGVMIITRPMNHRFFKVWFSGRFPKSDSSEVRAPSLNRSEHILGGFPESDFWVDLNPTRKSHLGKSTRNQLKGLCLRRRKLLEPSGTWKIYPKQLVTLKKHHSKCRKNLFFHYYAKQHQGRGALCTPPLVLFMLEIT